jgi:hypothetical protein
MRLIIKGSVTQLGDGEFASDIVYLFRITPMMQDRNGNDRAFTFNCYTKRNKRDTPKHSPERKEIARTLRLRHKLIWRTFHDAMDR